MLIRFMIGVGQKDRREVTSLSKVQKGLREMVAHELHFEL